MGERAEGRNTDNTHLNPCPDMQGFIPWLQPPRAAGGCRSAAAWLQEGDTMVESLRLEKTNRCLWDARGQVQFPKGTTSG